MFCVAPMMAYTDRHCRYLHRLHAPSVRLFTEMVSTSALIHGEQWHLLEHDPAEHPVVLQLGGNDPRELARCAGFASAAGFDEINLNVGCPSSRVQEASIGACLMKTPEVVAECIDSMRDSTAAPVTVKCRLGVDDLDTSEFLERFIDAVEAAGCTRLYIHARKALLSGLSPAQNRSVPPLQPWRVRQVKDKYPHLEIVINGGITTSAEAMDHLEWADGVMIGRAAYQTPGLLSEIERHLIDPDFHPDLWEIFTAYRAYMQEQLHRGVALRHLIRPALSLTAGLKGARRYRRMLSDADRLRSNSIDVFDEAFEVFFRQAA